MLFLVCLDLGLPMFWFWCMLKMKGYSLKCTYNIQNYPFLFNIANFVFWIHWTDAYTEIMSQGYLPDKSSDNTLQKFASFVKILKHWKSERSRKILHKVVVPSVVFGFPYQFVWIWVLHFYVWVLDFLCYGLLL